MGEEGGGREGREREEDGLREREEWGRKRKREGGGKEGKREKWDGRENYYDMPYIVL